MATCKHCKRTLILKGGVCLHCGKSPNEPLPDEETPEGTPEKEVPETETKETPEEKPVIITKSSESALPAVRTFKINGISFNMILVEGGTFWMGEQNLDPRKPNYDPDAEGDNVKQVTVDSFYIGETVVTSELMKALFPDVGDNSFEEGESQETPIVNYGYLSHAKLIASECMAQTGEFFRIPTEEEWEFAARGGNKSKGYRFSGSNILKEVGWYWGNRNDVLYYKNNTSDNKQGKIRIPPKVKEKKANELGIYDMSGLVFEICGGGEGEVYKGGCCESPSSECRIAYTTKKCDEAYTNLIGLRFAMTPRY